MSVLVATGKSEATQGWYEALRAALPEETVVRDDGLLDRAAISIAVVAAPPAGLLHGLPNLKLIQSLWAGVDDLMGDPDLPVDVPLARLVDPALTAAMVESAVLHVLSLHL
jgi:glyoxylate/hydroxypyruvate reductase A